MEIQRTLKGTHVIGMGGRVIGEVHDVAVDPTVWRVCDLVIRVSSSAVADLGIDQPFWARALLTIPIEHVSEVTEFVLLRTTLQEFAEIIGRAAAEP